MSMASEPVLFLSAVGSAFLGLILAGAGISKAVHWDTLPAVVRAYGVLPSSMVLPLARILPVIEVLLGGALLTRAAQPWATAAAASLLAAFAVAMAIAMRKGRREIDCGCFQGGLKQTLDWRLVARNVMLVLVAIFCTAFPSDIAEGRLLALLAALGLLVVQFSLSSLWALDASRERFLQRLPQ